jgi:uncharacterized protein (DUF1499 family)
MTLSLVALGIAVLAFLLIGAAGPAYRVGVPLSAAFTLLRWGAYVGLAATALAVVAAVAGRWHTNRLATGLAILAAVVGLTAAGIPFAWQQRAGSVPPIHDITTDLENPPQFKAALPLRTDAANSLDRPAALADQQRKGYPDVAPLTLSLPPADAFTRALAAAQQMEWEVIGADPAAGRIEAVDTTRWFGFKDDIVVRLTPWGSGTRVDVRSASRVGLSDIGTNARRIRDYLERLKEG